MTIDEDIIAISDLEVQAFRFPTDAPESDGTLQWDNTTMILTKLSAGNKTGIGYTYGNVAIATLIYRTLRHLVIGINALNVPEISHRLTAQMRNNGTTGLGMMAISAIDIAAWDLKAKLLDLPLVDLLGASSDKMPLYGSGGFTSYTLDRLQRQLGHWADSGFAAVKMKIGKAPEQDIQRVKLARAAIGDQTELYVDANGGYTVRQALDKAAAFALWDVHWFEEPVAFSNLRELRFLRTRFPPGMNMALGEYGYVAQDFLNILTVDAADILQADATRCGGITGFLKAGYLSEAWQIPFSSHCAPIVHLHPALALSNFFIAEYFYDHVQVEETCFEGIPQPVKGVLYPNRSEPGLGISIKTANLSKYKI